MQTEELGLELIRAVKAKAALMDRLEQLDSSRFGQTDGGSRSRPPLDRAAMAQAGLAGSASVAEESELVKRLLDSVGHKGHSALRDEAARLERELIARLHGDDSDDGSPETRVRRLEARLEAHAAELAVARADERRARREATAAAADAESERINAETARAEADELRAAHEERVQLYRTRLAKYASKSHHSSTQPLPHVPCQVGSYHSRDT